MKHKTHIISKICNKFIAENLTKKAGIPFMVFLSFFFLFTMSSFAQNTLVPFTFKLTVSAKTSAGVFRKDGTLIRTLWGGVSYPAGTHTKTWDRKDDEGNLVTDTGLVVKVLSNNVDYKWEGVIGNTSDSIHGGNVMNSYYRMEGMAISGNNAYYTTGYSEGSTATNRFALNRPHSRISIMYHQFGTNLAVTFVATDGNYVYWSGLDPFGGQYSSTSEVSLTYATKVSNDAEVLFASGSPVQMGTGRTYQKAIDIIYNNTATGNPTGLAVQKTGKYLFIAHGGLNKINVLNKTTGATVTSFNITNPRELCIDANDNLWIISGTKTVGKYTVDATTGTISSTPVLTISGLLSPLSLTVSPNNYQITILDGGASQQVKSFSNVSGVALWTYGQYGGYETDPSVSDDKFYFTDTVATYKQFIAYQPDSSFWVADPGNERVQHYTSARTYINYIMFMPATYSIQADRNNPTRVFNQFLEFKVDYTKPLSPNNGSWKLVRNWRHAVPRTHVELGYINKVFDNIVTMSNGRTYATLMNMQSNTGWYPEIVELPATGHIRLTGIKFTAFSDEIIEIDGSRRIYASANGNNGDSGVWKTKKLTGFNGSGNPVWGTDVKVGSIYAMDPKDPSYDPIFGTLSYPVKTSSDILVIFNTSLKDGYHLGGVKVGTNKYLWKTAAATFMESSTNADDQYQGEFPSDGSYDIGNNVMIGGSNAYTIGKNIFWNYHGEAWQGGQTNKWNHVYDDGLFVSQFGITTREARSVEWDAPEKLAGNVFSATAVMVGSDCYLYHNDEAVHSGLHRWKITGMNTIQEETLPISNPTISGGLVGAYYDGTDLNNFNLKIAIVDSVVNITSAPAQISNQGNFSARWTGFIEPKYSQNYTIYAKVSKGVKLWLNDIPVISQWNNSALIEYSTAAIKLEAGKKYTIEMEISGGSATLSWSSSSQVKQIIPATSLYPSDITDYTNDGINLMEGLPYRSVLTDGMYGWNRNPAAEDNTSGNQNWHVQTNMRSFDKNNPDVLIKFRSNTKTAFVTRSLPTKTIPCMKSWKITGNISYAGNDANLENMGYGGYFDVLDNAGKVICRITNEGQNNYTKIKCNNVSIVDAPDSAMNIVTGLSQPFEINTDSVGITFKYAGYTPIKVKLFDAASNWKKPATIKFNFTSHPTAPNYDKMISVEKLRFLTVSPTLPQVYVSGPTNLCQGDSVTLSSSSASSYLWNNNATTQTIKVKTTGNYSVIVKDPSGCLILPSDTIKVVVNPLPVATITANKPTALCQGDTITLTAGNANTYLWSNNLKSKSISTTAAGNYSVVVKDAVGCTSASSAPVTITTKPLPVAPTITADKLTTFCLGDTVTLTSSPANAYLWNNNAITQSIQVTSTGNYMVKAFDVSGCSNKSAATPVIANIIPTTIVTSSGPTTFCEGESVTLTSSPAIAYLWSTNETTQSIIVDVSGNNAVVTTDANQCMSVSPVTTVTVNPLPVSPVISITGNILTSSAISGNQWYLDDKIIPGATSQTFVAVQDGNYTVQSSDGNGCTAISNPVNYNNPANGIDIIGNNKNFSILPNPGTGKFMVRQNNSGLEHFKVYNNLGALIFESDLFESEIDLTAFSKGVYFIKVYGNNYVGSEKIIIQ